MRVFGNEQPRVSYRDAIERRQEVTVEDDAEDERE